MVNLLVTCHSQAMWYYALVMRVALQTLDHMEAFLC